MCSHDKFTPRGKFAPRGKLMHINWALVREKKQDSAA